MNLGTIKPGDPRICQSFAVGLAREGIATSVILYLAPTGSDQVKALNVQTPAEARDMAYKLWEAAKQADAEMDGHVTGKGEQDD